MSFKPQQDIKSDNKKSASELLKSMWKDMKECIKIVEKKLLKEENMPLAKSYLTNAERIISEMFNYIYNFEQISK